MDSVIRTIDLTKQYKQGDYTILANNNINISINRGEFVAIVGSSGSGKTTFLNLVGGVVKPTSGKILIENVDLLKLKENEYTKFRARKIGYIFQDFNLIDELSVLDNIRVVHDLNGWIIDKDFERSIIDLLEISNIVSSYPKHLSGGQKQRVAIARALLAKPSILLADEPTGNLDKKRTEEIMRFLINSNREFNQTIIMVTHDNSLACRCSRTIVIEDGVAIEDIQNEANKDTN